MKYKLIKMINDIIQNSGIKAVPGAVWSKAKADQQLYNFIMNQQITFGDSFSQRIYNIFYDIKQWPKCQYQKCQHKVLFQGFTKGYRKTCSKWCTNYVKYGCKSTFGTKEQHQKAKQTCLKKYRLFNGGC